MKHFTARLMVLSVTTLAACGGSTNSDESLSYATFSGTDATAIYGDWQQQYYVVRDQQTWDSVWASRRAALNCNIEYNKTACNSAMPPSVDFSSNTLVGIHLTGMLFLDPPLNIKDRKSEGRITVEYRWTPLVCGFGCPRGPSVLFVKISTRNPNVEIVPDHEWQP